MDYKNKRSFLQKIPTGSVFDRYCEPCFEDQKRHLWMLALRTENIATNNGKTYEGNILNIRQISPNDRPLTLKGNQFLLKYFSNKTHHPVIAGSLLLHTAPTPPCTLCPSAGR